jgi:hypothetical protein
MYTDADRAKVVHDEAQRLEAFSIPCRQRSGNAPAAVTNGRLPMWWHISLKIDPPNASHAGCKGT